MSDNEHLRRRSAKESIGQAQSYGEPIDAADSGHVDFGSIFPARGDSRRPPEWFGRAILMVIIAAFIAIYVWLSWGGVAWLFLDLVVCVFLALAMEPIILFLIRHGWPRAAAAGVTWVSLIVIVLAVLAVFGSLFVTQVIDLVQQLPQLYGSVSDFVAQNTSWKLPDINNLSSTLLQYFQSSWITDFAGRAVSTLVSVGSYFMSLMIIITVTYYIAASGPRMRQVICKLLRPESQRRFLVTWTVAQGQISSFLNSRIILAIISTAVNSIYLACTGVSYWLPLSLFYALISQFIPMVGYFIGAILPLVVVWTGQGFTKALILLVFIIVYQQIENMIIAPKIQQKTMSVNPALGLLAVFLFGALFGALGMFLALPITASVQVLFKAYMRNYDLVDSALLGDPEHVKKSKIVQVGEAISDHVLRPVTDHLPRSTRGTSARVTTKSVLADVEEDLRKLRLAPTGVELDDSMTVAIPKGGIGNGGARNPAPDQDELDESVTVAIPKGAISQGAISQGEISKADSSDGESESALGKLKGTAAASRSPRSLWKDDGDADDFNDGDDRDSDNGDNPDRDNRDSGV